MNTKHGKSDPFDTLLDVYVDELMSMPDEQVLDGIDPGASQREGQALLDMTKAEAGKRRLAAARAKQSELQSEASEEWNAITALEARAFLRQASNDGDYTLAARDLNDVSDDEAIHLYKQLKKLRKSVDTDPGEVS